MKLEEVLEKMAAVRPISRETKANYVRAIRFFERWLQRTATIDDLKEELITNWIARAEIDHTKAYAKNLRRDFLVTWRFAADLEIAKYPKNRLIRIPKIEERDTTSWPVWWIPLLFAAASRLEGKLLRFDVNRSDYAEAYFRVQADLLCRPSDMRRLKWDFVSSDGLVSMSQSKTGRRLRAKLSPETRQALAKIQRPNESLVFPLSKTATEVLIRKVFVEAGITKPQRQSLGHLRHTGGTAIANSYGNDIARNALGHSKSSRVFEAHYLDSSSIKTDHLHWWE